MIWQVLEPQEADTTHEFVVSALVLPIHKDAMLHCTATLAVVDGEQTETATSATASVALYRNSSYLQHLPSLYERDSFMGRFLMLFESFWAPIDAQIAGMHNYFDPDLTPARFLPWLATWFDLTLDEQWSEGQQRELLNAVMWLYRRRGTRIALQRYLEIFTQHPVEILEKRAKNMTLGNRARLGVGVALGVSNMPHTFTVRLQLPEIVPPPDVDAETAQREVARQERRRLALIERMIVAEKPAHTSYKLEITTIPAMLAQADAQS
jgi:phage tail-like protein